MSAICGIVNFDGKPVTEEEIRRMMAAMKDWGPDASGTWVQGCVGLGSLLFKVTPESVNERQPLLGADGQVAMVCDARIDNREELLGKLGPDLSADAPDAELVLAAYLKWGERCPVHLIGDFTVAVWDQRTRSLFLATDHLSHRPLFYMHTGDSIAFASSFFGLFAVRGMPDLVEDQLINYLLWRRGEPGVTFYQGILRVPGGHYAVVRGPSLRREAYWRVEDIPDIRYPRDEDYIEAFNEVFERAVRACCRSRLPVGIKRSGGLDSGAVAVVANKVLKERGERLQAYTAVPLPGFAERVSKDWLVDERPLVELLRKQHDFDVTYVVAEGASPLTDLERDFETLARPRKTIRNRYWIWSIADRAREDGVGVLLSGQLGNAAMSWNGHGYLASLLAQGRVRDWLGEVWLRRHRGLRSCLRETIVPLVPEPLWTLRRRLRVDDLCRRVFLRADNPRVRQLAAADGSVFSRQPPSDTRRARAIVLGEFEEIGEIKAGTAAGARVEYRDPTAVRNVVELALAIPDERHVGGGRDRLLIREALAGRLPEAIRLLPRQATQSADAGERMRAHWQGIRQLLKALDGNEHAKRLLDIDRMRAVVNALKRAESQAVTLSSLARLLAALALGYFAMWHVPRAARY
jgi:asparagine synthase (glutamine-hydrolysing)